MYVSIAFLHTLFQRPASIAWLAGRMEVPSFNRRQPPAAAIMQCHQRSFRYAPLFYLFNMITLLGIVGR